MTIKDLDKIGMRLVNFCGTSLRDVKCFAVFSNKKGKYFMSWSYDGKEFTEPVDATGIYNFKTVQRPSKTGKLLCYKKSTRFGKPSRYVGFDGYQIGESIIH